MEKRIETRNGHFETIMNNMKNVFKGAKFGDTSSNVDNR